MKLVIGNKNWSTWSLRPWLVLKRASIPFEEAMVQLRRGDETAAQIAAVSPSGKVPALIDGDLVVWDSLAICEYLADFYVAAELWPRDIATRALARAAAAEMHSGFQALRNECPMDLTLKTVIEPSDAVSSETRRVVTLWRSLRARYAKAGPFLVGQWSIADAFFTPLATRFDSYGIDLSAHGDEDGAARAYLETLLAQPEFLEWKEAALAERPAAS
jgi:glutathione S-transferase